MLFTVTPSAIDYLRQLLIEEPEGTLLRLAVGATCGQRYSLQLDDSTNPLDTQIEVSGISFTYPKHVSTWIQGITIDTVDHGDGPAIVIYPPKDTNTPC